MNSISTTPVRKVVPAWALAVSWCLLAADSVASMPEQPGGSYWLAVSDQKLDELRGGFVYGNGLVFSIGIERATYINGALITTTSFNFHNLDRLGAELTSKINKQVATLIQNGPRNTFQIGPASPAAASRNAPAASATAVTQNTATAAGGNASAGSATAVIGSTSTSSATATGQASSASATAVAQNTSQATTSTFVLDTPSAGPATFIQNTLNDQHIRNLTVINATVNSMGLMKNLNSLATLQEALNNSIHSRW